MIDHTAVIGQFKGRVLHAYGLIYAAWLAVSDFMVDMFHAENIAKCDYRWQPVAVGMGNGIIYRYMFDYLRRTLIRKGWIEPDKGAQPVELGNSDSTERECNRRTTMNSSGTSASSL